MKKLPLTLIAVMALAVWGTVTQAQTPTMKGKETSLQNRSVVYEQPKKEAVENFSQSSDDMCVGRGITAYHENTRNAFISIDVYETNNACGNYYAIYQTERYKVFQREKEIGGYTYHYYIIARGQHYFFNF